MKKINPIYSILLIGILLTSISCDDNSRSLGSFGIDIATVVPEGDNAYSLLLDNGKNYGRRLLRLVHAHIQPASISELHHPIGEDGEYDHYIKVNDIWNILTKEAIELNAQNADSIGHDPVRINHIWVGRLPERLVHV